VAKKYDFNVRSAPTPGNYVMKLSGVPHTLADGISLEILMRDEGRIGVGLVRETDSRLFPLNDEVDIRPSKISDDIVSIYIGLAL